MNVARVIPGLLALALTLACGRSPAQAPEAEALRRATQASAPTPQGWRQEALGRLVFDVPMEVDWGVRPPIPGSLNYGFEGWKPPALRDGVVVDGIDIQVAGPASMEEMLVKVRVFDSEKRITQRDISTRMETKKEIIKDLRQLLMENKDDPKRCQELQAAIDEHEKYITDGAQRIKALDVNWHLYDLSLPDSGGYQQGTTLHAFLWRNGMIFYFKNIRAQTMEEAEAEKPVFKAFLERFRLRKPGEIPTEPGICIPHGFIPDDGKRPYFAYLSFRFKDAPGVVYSFETCPPEDRPHGMGMNLMDVGGILSAEGLPSKAGRTVKQIRNAQAPVGGLTGSQLGTAITLKRGKRKPLETYQVITDVKGKEGSQMRPDITVVLRSFPPQNIPAVKVEPPPFSQSWARYEGILRNLRIRPTTPPMPELVAAEGKAAPKGTVGGTGK